MLVEQPGGRFGLRGLGARASGRVRKVEIC